MVEILISDKKYNLKKLRVCRFLPDPGVKSQWMCVKFPFMY